LGHFSPAARMVSPLIAINVEKILPHGFETKLFVESSSFLATSFNILQMLPKTFFGIEIE
jgi:hypothetical protein